MASSVLVVDDDVLILNLVTAVLEDEGLAVRSTSNSREALAWALVDLPDLILLDMRMPILDGWEFARSLRSEHPDAVIVVMTAAVDARAWSREVGAVGYVPKPFDLDNLVSVVREALAPQIEDAEIAAG